MKKRYYATITHSKSIEQLIKDLEAYRDSLDYKMEQFVRELTRIGVTALNAKIKSISPFYRGNDMKVDDVVVKTEEGWSAIISMNGKQALFIEFGSGVTFNTSKGGSKHPKGVELGYTIGSYNPSSPNATNPNGWWYYDEWGNSQHTYGTPTFAPMYNSSLEMISAIRDIAERVFNE